MSMVISMTKRRSFLGTLITTRGHYSHTFLFFLFFNICISAARSLEDFKHKLEVRRGFIDLLSCQTCSQRKKSAIKTKKENKEKTD